MCWIVDQRRTLILNPDILLTGDVLEDMAAWLLARPGAAMATPQLRYPDGKLQHLPRRKPTPWLLLARQLARSSAAALRRPTTTTRCRMRI